MTVWKYEFDIVDLFSIPLPKGATVLHVALQNDMPCMWALVDSTQEVEPRRFCVVGTGHTIQHDHVLYIGTIHQPPFVWHVFAVGGY